MLNDLWYWVDVSDYAFWLMLGALYGSMAVGYAYGYREAKRKYDWPLVKTYTRRKGK